MPDLDHTNLPDIFGRSITQLMKRMDKLEDILNVHDLNGEKIEVTEDGDWREDNFFYDLGSNYFCDLF